MSANHTVAPHPASSRKWPIHIWTDHVEDSAMRQLEQLATLPFLHPHGIAVMPDVHAGIGSTVGSVIATERALIPAAVGVDIGCGMNAVLTNLTADDLPDSLSSLRTSIERRIPMGAGQGHREDPTGEHAWATQLEGILRKHPKIGKTAYPSITVSNALQQRGSLGGGNHFVELCLDEQNRVWLMLHSGSRGIGNQIGRYFIDQAKEMMALWHIELAHQDLAYLPQGTPLFNDYVTAVSWAQDYALENRRVMMVAALTALQYEIHPHDPHTVGILGEAVNCHHNYVELENHYGRNVYVTRKGAIRARVGDLGIIPGSMGRRSYIVRGRGNPESYCSSSHGAGRQMSRTQARANFSLADLAEQTSGVECRKDANVIDEIPGAYKDLDGVMAHQADLVEIVHTLKAVLCCKGN